MQIMHIFTTPAPGYAQHLAQAGHDTWFPKGQNASKSRILNRFGAKCRVDNNVTIRHLIFIRRYLDENGHFPI